MELYTLQREFQIHKAKIGNYMPSKVNLRKKESVTIGHPLHSRNRKNELNGNNYMTIGLHVVYPKT